MIRLLAVVVFLTAGVLTLAQNGSRMTSKKDLPPGYWPTEKSQPIIDKTQTIRLTTDLSHLSAGERKAVERLIEAGKIFQSLYEKQRHPQALSSFAVLIQLDKQLGSTAATQNLLTLYR